MGARESSLTCCPISAGKITDRDNDRSKISAKVREVLSKENLPPTAPIVLHGHGQDHSDSHVIEFSRNLNGGSNFISSAILLKDMRAHAPENPIWISSCHSGCSLYKDDVCAGTSCMSGEISYARYGTEKTLDVIGNLIANEKEFKKADANQDKILNAKELNQYFCSWFQVGKKRQIRLTTRPKGKDPFKKLYKETIYLGKKEDFKKKIESIKSESEKSNVFSSISTFDVKQYKIIGDKSEIRNVDLEKQLFVDDEEAEKWAYKNLTEWPYYGTETWSQWIGFSDIKRKRYLQSQEPLDTIVEVTMPDKTTQCKIWDEGQRFPNYVPPGGQTPQFNHFRLYSPSYIWTTPHKSDGGDSSNHQ